MKVIEELVNYLKSEGLISDANVDWLRAEGVLPGFANSSDASDFDSDLSRDGGDDSSESHSDALDELAEQQTQEGLRRKLGAWSPSVHSLQMRLSASSWNCKRMGFSRKAQASRSPARFSLALHRASKKCFIERQLYMKNCMWNKVL
jgi:hypothetical protein